MLFLLGAGWPCLVWADGAPIQKSCVATLIEAFALPRKLWIRQQTIKEASDKVSLLKEALAGSERVISFRKANSESGFEQAFHEISIDEWNRNNDIIKARFGMEGIKRGESFLEQVMKGELSERSLTSDDKDLFDQIVLRKVIEYRRAYAEAARSEAGLPYHEGLYEVASNRYWLMESENRLARAKGRPDIHDEAALQSAASKKNQARDRYEKARGEQRSAKRRAEEIDRYLSKLAERSPTTEVFRRTLQNNFSVYDDNEAIRASLIKLTDEVLGESRKK